MPLLARERGAAREREHDLAADAGRRLAAAVGEDDDAEPRIRDHADIGRGVVEPAVLVDDLEAVVLHPLPGERLGEAGPTVNTPCCANAIASRSGALSGSAPRLAARKRAMSRADEYICPVPGQLNMPCWLAGLTHRLRVGIVALHRAAPAARSRSCRAGQGAASPSVARSAY